MLDNPLITPEAVEFRQSLFDLAQLYYRTNRFEEAIAQAGGADAAISER